MVRYDMWCDTIYKDIRGMMIYEKQRYMHCGDLQNKVMKKTWDTIIVEKHNMGRYEMLGDTRCGTKYGDMRDVVRCEMWCDTR